MVVVGIHVPYQSTLSLCHCGCEALSALGVRILTTFSFRKGASISLGVSSVVLKFVVSTRILLLLAPNVKSYPDSIASLGTVPSKR